MFSSHKYTNNMVYITQTIWCTLHKQYGAHFESQRSRIILYLLSFEPGPSESEADDLTYQCTTLLPLILTIFKGYTFCQSFIFIKK